MFSTTNPAYSSQSFVGSLIVLLDGVGFSMLIPVLPFVMMEKGAKPALVALLVAVYGLAGFVGSPIIGALSDRYGRVRVVKISLLLSAATYIGMLSAWSIVGILTFRALTGAFIGRDAVIRALVADSAPSDRHARVLGTLTAAGAAGAALGPILGAAPAMIIGHGDHHVLLLSTAAMLNVLAFAVATIAWPSASENAMGAALANSPRIRFGERRNVLLHLSRPLAISALLSYAWGVVFSTTALLVKVRFGWTEIETGWILSLGSIAVIVARILVVPRLVDKLGIERAGMATACVAAPMLAAMGLVTDPASYVVACNLFLIAISVAALTPSVLISTNTKAQERGFALGARQSLATIMMFGGAGINGLLFQFVAPSAAYIAGSAAIIAAFGLFAWGTIGHGRGAVPSNGKIARGEKVPRMEQ